MQLSSKCKSSKRNHGNKITHIELKNRRGKYKYSRTKKQSRQTAETLQSLPGLRWGRFKTRSQSRVLVGCRVGAPLKFQAQPCLWALGPGSLRSLPRGCHFVGVPFKELLESHLLAHGRVFTSKAPSLIPPGANKD